MNFKIWLETRSTGIVNAKNKVLLTFDEVDKKLFDHFAQNYSKVIAAKVILARYGYLRPDLQQKAIESGVYFSDSNIINIKGKAILVDAQLERLQERVKELIPLFTRWGGGNPSADTGIPRSRLDRGMQLNYHAKSIHQPETSILHKNNDIKDLTYDGNKFIDDILFNPKTIETKLKTNNGQTLTNKDILNIIEKFMLSTMKQGEDLEDMIAAGAMEIRNKYGLLLKSQDVVNDIKNMSYAGLLKIRTDEQRSGHHSKNPQQLGRSQSIKSKQYLTLMKRGPDIVGDKRKDMLGQSRDQNQLDFDNYRDDITQDDDKARQSFNSYIKIRDKVAEELKKKLGDRTYGRTFSK